MRRSSGQLFPIFLLGFLAALSYWLQLAADLPDTRHDGKTRHDPDAIAENFSVRRFNETGQLQYYLTSPKMLHYPDDDSSVLSNAKLTYYRPGAPDLTIYGKSALVTAKGDTVYLTEEVVATRAPTVNRPELVATMPDLTVYPDKGIAETLSPVEITQGPTWIKGVGFSLDNNASVMHLNSQVTGLLFRNKQTP